LVFGGYITFFLYLLITVLYSALSSVPNPSLLPTYPEESIIWIIVLLFFICCLLGTGMFYWWNDDFKTYKIDIKESDMG
jgi:4-hydroxybenzoate polyprenyltransferase